MKKTFYLFLAILYGPNLIAQTKTWVGGNVGGATNWNIAANWNPFDEPSEAYARIIRLSSN